MGQWVGSGQITKYQINLDLIRIIQFCLKIYVFVETPQAICACLGGWKDGCVDAWVM